jgi:hypothetical protein
VIRQSVLGERASLPRVWRNSAIQLIEIGGFPPMSDLPVIVFDVNVTLVDLETMAPILLAHLQARHAAMVGALDAPRFAVCKQNRKGGEA